MVSKPQIQAVPTPLQVLREAIAERDAAAAQADALRAKADMFAPVQAEVAAAEAAMHQVLQKDIDAMHAWAEAGATTAPPEPSTEARKEAAQRVAAARTKLETSAGAVRQFEQQMVIANQRYGDALPAVTNAQRPVLGEELLRRAHDMKEAARIYIAAEQLFFRIHRSVVDFGGMDDYLARAAEITKPLTLTEEMGVGEVTRIKSEQILQALMRGEEVADA
jgi:hypothetical protein